MNALHSQQQVVYHLDSQVCPLPFLLLGSQLPVSKQCCHTLFMQLTLQQ